MKSVLLIGVGKFGSLVAKELYRMGHQTMAVDVDERKVTDIMRYVTDAQIGDSTDPAFLRSLGIAGFDLCIVAIGEDFQSSLETTSLLKEMGAKMVVARADRDIQEKFLLRNGADEVVNPEMQVAKWTVIRYTSEHILDFIQLDESHAIFEVSIPSRWIGKSISQIDIRKKYGINIMAVKDRGKMELSVLPSMILNKDMKLLILGEQKAMQKCFRT
ncbi:MAG: TrkA family potassium uptake protein [Lachnospiraceae bacterium]|nr:TrkA family potassium uptake protein [Lachnospiraceae bacterium]